MNLFYVICRVGKASSIARRTIAPWLVRLQESETSSSPKKTSTSGGCSKRSCQQGISIFVYAYIQYIIALCIYMGAIFY